MSELDKKITNTLYEHGYINFSQIDAYVYSFEITIASIVNLFLALVSAFYFQVFFEGVVYLITYAILRKNTGGFHFNNYILCIGIYWIICVISFAMMKEIYISENVKLIIILLCYVYILIVSPIENKNNPLTSNQVKYLTVKIRKIVFFLFMLSIFLKSSYLYLTAILISAIQVCFFLMIEKIKEYFLDRRKSILTK